MNTQNNYNVEISTVEVYRFRAVEPVNSGEWADITIDTQPGSTAGRIAIHSGFGAWDYSWGACGLSFKKFICQLDKNYVAIKFGCHLHFDVGATIKAYECMCWDSYLSTHPENRKTMLQIAHLSAVATTKEEFISFINSNNGNLIRDMYEGTSIDLCTTIYPRFARF